MIPQSDERTMANLAVPPPQSSAQIWAHPSVFCPDNQMRFCKISKTFDEILQNLKTKSDFAKSEVRFCKMWKKMRFCKMWLTNGGYGASYEFMI